MPEPAGKPIVALDLGAGRAWSAAVGVWESGRVEALAVAPGIPSLADQEATRPRTRHDVHGARGARPVANSGWSTCSGTGGLVAACGGTLGCSGGRRVRQVPAGRTGRRGTGGTPLEARVSRWSEASADIRALRRLAKDGPWTVDADSRLLIAASLAAAVVKSDDQGSTRLVKSANNTARDDVAAALTLAAGAYQRTSRRPVHVASYVVV